MLIYIILMIEQILSNLYLTKFLDLAKLNKNGSFRVQYNYLPKNINNFQSVIWNCINFYYFVFIVSLMSIFTNVD